MEDMLGYEVGSQVEGATLEQSELALDELAKLTRTSGTACSECKDPPTAPLTWAEFLKRVFEIDITLCPLCGGQLRVIADITDPDLIRKILDHVNSRAPPRLPPRRAEPNPNLTDLFATG